MLLAAPEEYCRHTSKLVAQCPASFLRHPDILRSRDPLSDAYRSAVASGLMCLLEFNLEFG